MNGSSHTEPPSRAGSSTGSSADTKAKKRRESFDGLDDKEELRILNIETALKERRDVRGSVSAVQLVKLAQFQRTQERIQRMKKIKWYIIDPHSTAMQVWDAATALSLIFTAIATPIEVAFIPAPKCGLETLYIINRTVDAIFMVDMALQFFLSHPVKANVWEVRMHVIAKRYLRGWFFLDVISLFPSFFEYPAMWADCNAPPPVRARTSAAATRTSSAHVSLHFSHLFLFCAARCCSQDKSKDPMASLRVIRAFRLIKLVRLLRSPWALVKRLVIRIATPRATVTICSLLLECFFVSHLFACLLGMIATFAASPLATWLGTHGYCKPDDVDPNGFLCVGPEMLYLQCLWWSVGMLMVRSAAAATQPSAHCSMPFHSLSL